MKVVVEVGIAEKSASASPASLIWKLSFGKPPKHEAQNYRFWSKKGLSGHDLGISSGFVFEGM